MSQSDQSGPPRLTLNVSNDRLGLDDKGSDRKDRASGASFNLHGIDLSSFDSDLGATLSAGSPIASPVASPTSPRQRDPAKNFLSSFKSRVSPEQDRKEHRGRLWRNKEDGKEDAYRPGTSGMSKVYHLKKNPGSTPELNLVESSEAVGKQESEANESHPDFPNHQTSPPRGEDTASLSKRKESKGFRNPLARSKSVRRDSASKSRPVEKGVIDQPPKTAPLSQDWPDSNFLRAKSKEKRGKSADRSGASESEENLPMSRDRGTNTFKMGGKQVMSRAKTGGGLILNRLGKMARSGSSHEKEIPDNEYVLKVINMPLVEQTRITRISKSLDSCRDKTEYWMPSLPWRCIDYLNLNCEHEGLYRVPGSAPEVKRWQRRFDTELDVDLLDETELYDPNTISSMLKSWLRDLPTEIMPKALQHALGEELLKDNSNYQRLNEPVPQKLRNALSLLPPYNYYLLFAITCHLSLLLSHKDKNKMDLNNLSICIGPPLDLERWLFNYLVGDWRNCWQGCFTENTYREAEKANNAPAKALKFPDGPFDFNAGPDAYQTRDAQVIGSVEEPPPAISSQNVSRSGSPFTEKPAAAGSTKSTTTGVMNGRFRFPNNGPDSTSDANRPSTTAGKGPTTTSTNDVNAKDAHSRSQSEAFSLPIMSNSTQR